MRVGPKSNSICVRKEKETQTQRRGNGQMEAKVGMTQLPARALPGTTRSQGRAWDRLPIRASGRNHPCWYPDTSCLAPGTLRDYQFEATKFVVLCYRSSRKLRWNSLHTDLKRGQCGVGLSLLTMTHNLQHYKKLGIFKTSQKSHNQPWW